MEGQSVNKTHLEYKLLSSISNNTEVYEKPVLRIKHIPHHAVKFEASEKNRIVYESLYCECLAK